SSQLPQPPRWVHDGSCGAYADRPNEVTGYNGRALIHASRWCSPAAAVALLVTCLSGPAAPEARAAAPEAVTEVRGLWVLRTSLTSPDAIDTLVARADAAGFNALFVQVRGRADAYYASSLEPRGSALAAQPAGFDPLAQVIARAHASGIAVHAWFNVNLVADSVTLPTAPDHVIRRHPDWLMVPRALAGQADPHRAGFVERL